MMTKIKSGDIPPSFIEKMCIKYDCDDCPLWKVNCAIYMDFTDDDMNIDVFLNEDDMKLFNEKAV